MQAATAEKTYRSPLKKLVKFFRQSRDGWKRKCGAAKAKAKRFYNHITKLKASRNHWKEIARRYRDEAAQLRQELAAVKNSPLLPLFRPRPSPRRSLPPCRNTTIPLG
jgi:uncharacterized coiled-coil DUF342 family protein